MLLLFAVTGDECRTADLVENNLEIGVARCGDAKLLKTYLDQTKIRRRLPSQYFRGQQSLVGGV